jgi:hypothetical protein
MFTFMPCLQQFCFAKINQQALGIIGGQLSQDFEYFRGGVHT